MIIQVPKTYVYSILFKPNNFCIIPLQIYFYQKIFRHTIISWPCPFIHKKVIIWLKKRPHIITQIAKKPVERCSCKFYYYTVTRIHGGKDKKGLSICLLVTEKQPFENRSSQQLRSDHAALL